MNHIYVVNKFQKPSYSVKLFGHEWHCCLQSRRYLCGEECLQDPVSIHRWKQLTWENPESAVTFCNTEQCRESNFESKWKVYTKNIDKRKDEDNKACKYETYKTRLKFAENHRK